MRKLFFTLLVAFLANQAFADSILIESFEYANHDFEKPTGWICENNSWLCGYLEKDHNRIPHSGNWYAFSNADESWMYMPLYLITSMHYRFTCWAISDGEFQLEFWTGKTPDPNSMHTQLLSATINGDTYDSFTVPTTEELAAAFPAAIPADAKTDAELEAEWKVKNALDENGN